ncbi:MAG TPA: acetylglutamate kinase, partial [Ktedonobacteraceae bacterium]
MTTLLSQSIDPNPLPSQEPSLIKIVQEAMHVITALQRKTLVVKLGGSTLEHQKAVLQDLVWLHSLGAHVVLVHGGGPYIDEWLNKLAIPVRFEQGLRVTDAQTLEIVRLVLCGQINPQLVSMTTAMGGKAIGFSGADGYMIRAHVTNERLGLVGEIDAIDPAPVLNALDKGYIPIIAPLGLDENGQFLNINADLVASLLAGALKADRLVMLSNVCGICQADGSLIPQLDEDQASHLIAEGVIRGGMLPKIRACLQALADVP